MEVEIKTKDDFQKHKLIMQNTVSVLLEIGSQLSQLARERLQLSDAEAWIKEVDIIKPELRFIQGIPDFSLETLTAFHISSKLVVLLDTVGSSNKNQFQIFQEVFSLLKNSPLNDYEAMKGSLKKYLTEKHAEYAVNFIDKFLPSIRVLHFSYSMLKPIKAWNLSNEVILKQDNFCDLIPESNEPRSIAFTLQHLFMISQKKPEKLSVEELQNLWVSAGLYFGEKGHPFCKYGLLFSLPQAIEFGREQIIVWYVVEKMFKGWKNNPPDDLAKIAELGLAKAKEERTKEEIIARYQLLYQILDEHKKITGPDKVTLLSEISKFLHFIQKEQKDDFDISNIDIYYCLNGLKGIINTFDYCQNQFRNLKKRQETPQLVVLVVGDSVAAGLRVPSNRAHERWVNRLEVLLNNLNLPLRVKVVNCSIAGYTTNEGLKLLPLYLRSYKPDVLICSLGGNDAHKHIDVYKILKNMLIFFKIAKRNNIKYNLWGMGIPEIFPVCEGYRNTFRSMQEDFTRKTGVKAVSMKDDILQKKNMDHDKLHFNAEIQESIAKFSCDAVAELVRAACAERVKKSSILTQFQQFAGQRAEKEESKTSPTLIGNGLRAEKDEFKTTFSLTGNGQRTEKDEFKTTLSLTGNPQRPEKDDSKITLNFNTNGYRI